jgi:hypothetical protein
MATPQQKYNGAIKDLANSLLFKLYLEGYSQSYDGQLTGSLFHYMDTVRDLAWCQWLFMRGWTQDQISKLKQTPNIGYRFYSSFLWEIVYPQCVELVPKCMLVSCGGFPEKFEKDLKDYETTQGINI